MVMIRKSSIAGSFYPGEPKELENTVNKFLSEVKQKNLPIPKAMIVPHAGYMFSGPVAASAYECLKNSNGKIKRVILFGPTHFYPVHGVAAPEADIFETPLGRVKVDMESIYKVLHLPQVKVLKEAHMNEHSLEIQLPFLQILLKETFSIVPFVVGTIIPERVADVLEELWGDDETLIVISSDLSHYNSYSKAQEMDRKTADAILALDYQKVDFEDACGRNSIQSLLIVASKKNLKAKLIDLRNSGDTAGDTNKVVGYGAFHFTETK